MSAWNLPLKMMTAITCTYINHNCTLIALTLTQMYIENLGKPLEQHTWISSREV